MQYTFKDILNEDLYKTSRVVFILGRYNIFNNIVGDEFKEQSKDKEDTGSISISALEEFGLEEDSGNGEALNSVNFNTFLEVAGVPSINGKWFCRVSLEELTKNNKEALLKYAREPSENGVLVITSNDWFSYKDILKLRFLKTSPVSHIVELGFPDRKILAEIVRGMFYDKGISTTEEAVEFFIMRMSREYDKYEEEMDTVIERLGENKDVNLKAMREAMKGIEYYTIDDFMYELVRPFRKKILKVMAALEDEMGASKMVYKILEQVGDLVELRVLINSGHIPVGIKFFYKDIIAGIGGEESKFGKWSEWKFRKKVELASMTSLRDWEYIRIILMRAVENTRVSPDELEYKCKKALYEVCMRSILTESRLNNIIGVDNILRKSLEEIDMVKGG